MHLRGVRPAFAMTPALGAISIFLICASSPGCQDPSRLPPRAAGRSEVPSGAGATPGAEFADSPIRFRDSTAGSGIAFRHTSGNSPEKHFPTSNGSGVAMLDYDGDGLLDLYFASTRGFPLDAPGPSMGNRLYRNRGDGTFEDVTARAGVGYNGFCPGVAAGDVNNDGFPDLYLCNYGANVLYVNRGDGTFRAVERSGAECNAWSSSAAFLDYDGDGRLDLYVACYGRWSYDEPHEYCGDRARSIRMFCPPAMIPPDRHFLLRNRGDGTFEDATERAGILRKDGRGLGVVAADVNRDGRIDLYVANDGCPHFLFLNRGDGTFEDVTATSGAASNAAGRYQGGMGVDVEDLDGDGLPELFVTNYANEYNTLHRTTDGHGYQDISEAAGIVKDSMVEVGWGCSLSDLDNDGWPDMMVVNGHTDENLAELGREGVYEQPTRIWRNRGDGRFDLVADPGPFFRVGHVGRGAAFGDLDNDGDIDVVFSRMDNLPAVLLNESPPRGWIRLELVGTASNRQAIGAAVEVVLDGRTLHRQVKGGGSYASANDPRLLIGVGPVERINRVEIRWPSGRRSTLERPELSRTHRIVEPVPPGSKPGPDPPGSPRDGRS
ncbi:CRTAC1 family protein [Aquisphaera insulae]|uniref:CRTAC1 family protein n=1 Tax=Aquisphaera insulae TaxID=2712864 RepID=UPI0013EDA391|nr:CRTAC1 family protein [Aquisphaera insulae]